MPDEKLSAEDQEELQTLAELVARALNKGEEPADISAQLVNNGWEQDAADEFVSRIALQLASAKHTPAPASGGGSGMSWLIWIGVILLINFLSMVFDWGFWVY